MISKKGKVVVTLLCLGIMGVTDSSEQSPLAASCSESKVVTVQSTMDNRLSFLSDSEQQEVQENLMQLLQSKDADLVAAATLLLSDKAAFSKH